MQVENLSILIAECEETMRSALVAQLQKTGFGRVLAAQDGEQALALMRTEKVDMVVAELNIPKLDGLALLEVMRMDPQLKHIGFVLMSCVLDRQSAQQAIRLGIGDLLVKPFSTRNLYQRMVAVLKKEHPSDLLSNKAAEERGTILVVDDTPDNLQVLANLFRDQFKVKVANTGVKALEICQSDSPPDLVLLDVMMPGMDGFEVASRLRQHHASAMMPIIFVSAVGEHQAREKGLALGAVDYVTKPLDPGMLKMRVRNLMRHVEYRKQLQVDFDRMREMAALRAELDTILRSEMKTPLNATMVALKSLQADGSLGVAQQGLVQVATLQTRHTQELIDRALALLQRGT